VPRDQEPPAPTPPRHRRDSPPPQKPGGGRPPADSFALPVLTERERELLDSVFYKQAKRGVFEEEQRPLSPAVAQSAGPMRRVSPLWTVPLPESAGAMGVALSPGGTLAAVACRDGTVRVLRADQGGETLHTIAPTPSRGGVLATAAATCVRFRPESQHSRTSNVLGLARGSALFHYHATTGQLMTELDEGDNEIFALDFGPGGSRVATAGSDSCVRVYDEARQALETTFPRGGEGTREGHSSNVYALAWANEGGGDVLVSGGWDSAIHVWDRRQKGSAGHMYGAYVCGDALDVRGHEVVSGSFREQAPLQLWDLRMHHLLTNLDTVGGGSDGKLQLYTARFGHSPLRGGGHMVAAGGAEEHPSVRVVTQGGQPVCQVEAASTVHAVAFATPVTHAHLPEHIAIVRPPPPPWRPARAGGPARSGPPRASPLTASRTDPCAQACAYHVSFAAIEP